MKVAVFGAGYVGLVTGACFAELGHQVVVRDVVEAKVDALRAGVVQVHEPGLDEILVRNAERLRFTIDVAEAVEGADVVYIAVGTPPTYSGDADLSDVWTVVDELPQVDRRIVLAMKSTVPVGTGRAVRHKLDERGLQNVGYVSNPEFTAEGTAVRDFMQPDRIVIGAFDEADGDVVAALHDGIDARIVRTDVPSAEMVKLASNAFLMTRVSFINEIANVCEATGADVVAVAEAVGLDHRLGSHFLRAGIGYGGSCFPKDSLALKQLAANSGYNFQLLNAVIEVNELQKRRVVAKLERRLGPLRGKRVALLGATGSIGRQALEVIDAHPELELVAASSRTQPIDGLAPATQVGGEPAELLERAEPDVVLNAIVGFAGVSATLWALERGVDLALANKESLVAAGELAVAASERGGGRLLPVDSEH